MEDYLNYLKESLSEPQEEIIVNEMSYFVSGDVKQILAQTPVVTKKELLSKIIPGDIMVAFTANKSLKDKFGAKQYGKILAAFQGSPYTSSKVALDKNYAAGYGITTNMKMPSDNKVEKVPLRQAISDRSEICLIRLDTTDAIKKKAMRWINSKMGLAYSESDLLKSTWDRFTNRKFFPFFKKNNLDPNELKELQHPLFCSSIIAIAYYVGGYKDKFNNHHPYDVWPRDFILDKNTEKICKIDYS
jgi:hypothetical protein